MFRRTLLLFAGFVALVLAITIGYAALGLGSPRKEIADADAAIAQGHLAEGIKSLDVAERTLTPSERAELLPAILERRFAAHRDLDNVTMARRDLDALLALEPDAHRALHIDQAALLLAAGEPQAALDVIQAHIRRDPGVRPGRAAEVAGQATQALYQKGMVELVASIGDLLAGDTKREALDELRGTLYRPADDPRGRAARDRFESLARRYAPSAPALDRWRRQIDDIRAGILRANEFYAQSLEHDDGVPAAAFRGLAYALQQAGREDDGTALSEIYLRRFDLAQSVEAALAMAESHLAAGRWLLAADVARRALPPGTALARAEEGLLSPACKQLLVVAARALGELHDRPRLQALSNDVIAVQQGTKVSMLPEFFLVRAYYLLEDGQTEHVLLALADYRRHRTVRTMQPRVGATDYYELAAEFELRVLEGLGGKMSEIDAVLADWLELRPDSPTLHRRRGRHHLATDRADLAVADAQRLLTLDPHDEDALALLVAATAAEAERAGSGPTFQLQRCLARGNDDPRELRHPALYLALGQLALEKGHVGVALRCGDLAARTYSWARWPRRLQIDAAIAIKDPERALRAAQTFRELHPSDPEALAAYRRASSALGRVEPELMFEAALHGQPDEELALALLTSAVRHPSYGQPTVLAERLAKRFPRSPRILLHAGEALAAHGQPVAGRGLMQRVIDEFPEELEVIRAAATQILVADANAEAPPPTLEASVRQFARLVAGDSDTALEIADHLEDIGRPELAMQLLQPLLDSESGTARNGRFFHLAGRLALESGAELRAEEFLTQALGFEDGAQAGPALALLWLRQGRLADAASAAWLREPKDESSACLLLALGRLEPARRWAQARRARAPLDVVASLVLALASGDDAAPPPGPLAALLPTHRDAVAELLPLLTMPGFQVLAERAAKRLRELDPKNPATGFLHARALARTGRRAEAITTLVQVIQQDGGFLPAYDEVLELSEGGLRGDISAVGSSMSKVVQAAPAFASPRIMTSVGHALATQIGAMTRQPDAAYEMLAKLWIQFPEESRVDLSHVVALNARGKSEDALLLLEAIEARLRPADRPLFLDLYFAVGQRLVTAGDAKQSDRLDAYARRVLEKEGAFGPVVHHLIDRAQAEHGPIEPDPQGRQAVQARALLNQHLTFVAGGHDRNVPAVLRSLGRLEQLDGTAAVLQRTDELLRADPTLLPVWRYRAQLLDRRGETEAAMASVRWIVDYVPDQDALLELARVAGSSGRLTAADLGLIDCELDPNVKARPHAQFPLALLALRQGDLTAADALLRTCPARSDGAHLFFLAIANVQRADGLAHAEKAFRDLHAQYADSPYALYAGHLAAQLTVLIAKERPSVPR